MERRLSCILAADVVGYSSLMEQDEAGTVQRLRAHRHELFEPEIAKHHGRIFKLMGDGLLAEFGSVVDAVECAVALQRGLAERNANVPEDTQIHARIGINLGEVIVEGEDRLGEGVNIAARLEQLAEPGGIYVSGKVAREVEKKLSFAFESKGEQKVKNIAEPVSVYRVKLDGLPNPRIVRKQAPSMAARLIAAALALAVVAGAAWFTMFRHTDTPTDLPRLAVLPFDNMSGDPKLDYFGDGVTEDVISMLARSPDLSVIARNSSFTYKGKAVDVRQVRKDLGVDYVLEGSVRKDADSVRIVAQLIDARTGEHVWADRFDKRGPDPVEVQDAMTSKIVASLTGEKGMLRQAQYRVSWGKDQANLDEYDYYLRGHSEYMKFNAEGLEAAGRIWNEGLAKYPNSALLKIKLTIYHLNRVLWGAGGDPAVDFPKAVELHTSAMSQPSLTPLERRLGTWFGAYIDAFVTHDFDKMMRDTEAAYALAPYDAWLVGDLTQFWIMNGDREKALNLLDMAIERDPANAPIFLYYLKGWAYSTLIKPTEAIDNLNRSEDTLFFVPGLRAINYARLGKMDEAKSQIEKAKALAPGFSLELWKLSQVYRNKEILNQELEQLAKLGVPEK